jgi:hypothetical protein
MLSHVIWLVAFHELAVLEAILRTFWPPDTTDTLHPFNQASFAQGGNLHRKRMIVHVDNCSVHRSATTESFMKTRDMVSMPHPPYLPGLAAGDFHFFLTVRESSNVPISLMNTSYSKRSTRIWTQFLEKNWEGSLRLGESAFRMSIKATEVLLTSIQLGNTVHLLKCHTRSSRMY